MRPSQVGDRPSLDSDDTSESDSEEEERHAPLPISMAQAPRQSLAVMAPNEDRSPSIFTPSSSESDDNDDAARQKELREAFQKARREEPRHSVDERPETYHYRSERTSSISQEPKDEKRRASKQVAPSPPDSRRSGVRISEVPPMVKNITPRVSKDWDDSSSPEMEQPPRPVAAAKKKREPQQQQPSRRRGSQDAYASDDESSEESPPTLAQKPATEPPPAAAAPGSRRGSRRISKEKAVAKAPKKKVGKGRKGPPLKIAPQEVEDMGAAPTPRRLSTESREEENEEGEEEAPPVRGREGSWFGFPRTDEDLTDAISVAQKDTDDAYSTTSVGSASHTSKEMHSQPSTPRVFRGDRPSVAAARARASWEASREETKKLSEQLEKVAPPSQKTSQTKPLTSPSRSRSGRGQQPAARRASVSPANLGGQPTPPSPTTIGTGGVTPKTASKADTQQKPSTPTLATTNGSMQTTPTPGVAKPMQQRPSTLTPPATSVATKATPTAGVTKPVQQKSSAITPRASAVTTPVTPSTGMHPRPSVNVRRQSIAPPPPANFGARRASIAPQRSATTPDSIAGKPLTMSSNPPSTPSKSAAMETAARDIAMNLTQPLADAEGGQGSTSQGKDGRIGNETFGEGFKGGGSAQGNPPELTGAPTTGSSAFPIGGVAGSSQSPGFTEGDSLKLKEDDISSPEHDYEGDVSSISPSLMQGSNWNRSHLDSMTASAGETDSTKPLDSSEPVQEDLMEMKEKELHIQQGQLRLEEMKHSIEAQKAKLQDRMLDIRKDMIQLQKQRIDLQREEAGKLGVMEAEKGVFGKDRIGIEHQEDSTSPSQYSQMLSKQYDQIAQQYRKVSQQHEQITQQEYGPTSQHQYGQSLQTEYEPISLQQYDQTPQYKEVPQQQYGQIPQASYGQIPQEQAQRTLQQTGQISLQKYGQVGPQQYGQTAPQSYMDSATQQYGQAAPQQYGQSILQNYGQRISQEYGSIPPLQQFGQTASHQQSYGQTELQQLSGQSTLQQQYGQTSQPQNLQISQFPLEQTPNYLREHQNIPTRPLLPGEGGIDQPHCCGDMRPHNVMAETDRGQLMRLEIYKCDSTCEFPCNINGSRRRPTEKSVEGPCKEELPQKHDSLLDNIIKRISEKPPSSQDKSVPLTEKPPEERPKDLPKEFPKESDLNDEFNLTNENVFKTSFDSTKASEKSDSFDKPKWRDPSIVEKPKVIDRCESDEPPCGWVEVDQSEIQHGGDYTRRGSGQGNELDDSRLVKTDPHSSTRGMSGVGQERDSNLSHKEEQRLSGEPSHQQSLNGDSGRRSRLADPYKGICMHGHNMEAHARSTETYGQNMGTYGPNIGSYGCSTEMYGRNNPNYPPPRNTRGFCEVRSRSSFYPVHACKDQRVSAMRSWRGYRRPVECRPRPSYCVASTQIDQDPNMYQSLQATGADVFGCPMDDSDAISAQEIRQSMSRKSCGSGRTPSMGSSQSQKCRRNSPCSRRNQTSPSPPPPD